MQRTLRQPGFWLACGLVCIGLAGQIFLSLPLELLDVALRAAKHSPLGLGRDPLAIGVINILAVGTTIGLGLLFNRQPLRGAFPLGRIAANAWLAVLLVAGGAAILLSELDNLLRWVLPPPRWIAELMEELFLAEGRFGSKFFTLVVVAPITEELLFRGIILRGLLGRFRPWAAILLSALLFGVMHLNPWQTIPTFVLGVAYAWFYVRSGSLWPGIVAHALNNFLFLVVMTGPFGLWEPVAAEDLVAAQFQPWWLNVSGALLLGAGITLFQRACPLLPSENQPPDPPVPPPPGAPPVLPR
jgi:membrane protease YdiL (CAAX protease family)